MKTSLRTRLSPGAGLPCLVCGVDSGPVLKLFLFVVGAGLLGSICVLVWGLATKKFRFNNEPALLPLQAEKEHTS